MNPEIKYFQRKLKEFENKQVIIQRILDNELEIILSQDDDIQNIDLQSYQDLVTDYFTVLKEIIRVSDHLAKLRKNYSFPLNVIPVFNTLSFGYRVYRSTCEFVHY